MAIYEIGGYTLDFTEDYYEYGKIKALLVKEAREGIASYKNLYDRYGNVENLLRTGENDISHIVLNVFNNFKSIALQRGIYDFSIDKLKYSSEYRQIIKPISEAISDIHYQLSAINSEEETTKEERRLRKATRGRVVGGGFGLTGALKGMAMAGAINMGTGLLHGSVNTVGNIFTSISASNDRRSLYKSAKSYLEDALWESISSLLPFICDVLNVRANIHYSKEQAILKNIQDGSFGDFDLRKPFTDAFLAYPFDDNLYKCYLLTYPEEQDVVVRMGKDFGVALDDFLENVCTYNGFRFNTIVEANYCIKTEELFLKQIADMTDEDFASNLFSVNVLENVANPLLVLGLSKKYSENIQVADGYEAVNEYRKYIVSRLQSVASKNNYPANIDLAYAYGTLNENLIFALGIYQAFFSNKKKLGDYSKFAISSYYFHFENTSEEIILGPCGVSVKKKKEDKSYVWINPANIKSIEYDKDFIGSTLFINDKKYKFNQIGNDMKFVVKMIKFLQRDLEWCFVHYYADSVKDANCSNGWAEALEKGYFANSDVVSAGYYYAQAALNGNVNAQNKIANYYHTGNLVNVNYECAKYWYTKAKNGGCEQVDNVLNDPAWLNVPVISDEAAQQNLSNDFKIQRGNVILMPSLQQTVIISSENAEKSASENHVQSNTQVTEISNSNLASTSLTESSDDNIEPKKSRWVYVIGLIAAIGAFNLLTDILGSNDETENIKPRVKHSLERKVTNNTSNIPQNNMVIQENAAPVVALDPREDIKTTGKKVVAKTRMVYIYAKPDKNSRRIGETYFAQTFAYLGSYGDWQRIYVPDYGGAYIPSEYANVLDDNVAIGIATINENTNYQKYANSAPKYTIGNLNQGENCDILGLIQDNNGKLWLNIRRNDGSAGYVDSSKCSAKTTSGRPFM